MGLKENIERIHELTRQAEAAGGEDKLKRQRESGRLTARERVEFLLDRGSFVEMDKFKTAAFEEILRGVPGRRYPVKHALQGSFSHARERDRPAPSPAHPRQSPEPLRGR